MAELRFDGKAAIVTGGGRGLGRAYARLLGARGCQVLVNDPGVTTRGTPESEGAAEQVAQEITDAGGGLAVADRNSVVDRADVVVEHALDEFGRLDVVINNAGISGGGAFDEMPAADFDLLVDTHYGGAVRVSRAAWPHLKQSGAGRIVNMSSASVFGTPFTSPYVSSKAGIFGLTRALAAEGAYSGIGVNAVMPAAYTRMTAQLPDDDGFRIVPRDLVPPGEGGPVRGVPRPREHGHQRRDLLGRVPIAPPASSWPSAPASWATGHRRPSPAGSTSCSASKVGRSRRT